jgi:hypothetical protein
MANVKVDTGHGASLVLSSTAYSFNWTSMDLGEAVREAIPDHTLATSNWLTTRPADLSDPGSVTLPFQFDPGTAIADVNGATQTATITFPMASGQTQAATLAGTGFITNVKRPNLQTNVIQDGSITFKFDGKTGPTFTQGG